MPENERNGFPRINSASRVSRSSLTPPPLSSRVRLCWDLEEPEGAKGHSPLQAPPFAAAWSLRMPLGGGDLPSATPHQPSVAPPLPSSTLLNPPTVPHASQVSSDITHAHTAPSAPPRRQRRCPPPPPCSAATPVEALDCDFEDFEEPTEIEPIGSALLPRA